MEALYDLEEVKNLVANNKYVLTMRVNNELLNHGYQVDEFVPLLFKQLQSSEYYKTVILANHPEKKKADVYRMLYDGMEWYVKFFEDDFRELHLEIWSLHWW